MIFPHIANVLKLLGTPMGDALPHVSREREHLKKHADFALTAARRNAAVKRDPGCYAELPGSVRAETGRTLH